MINLESGKFYQCDNHLDISRFKFKFKECIDNMINDEYHIYENNFYISPLPLCDINQYDIKEISLEEIVIYLPENHPDKIFYNRKQKLKMLFNLC